MPDGLRLDAGDFIKSPEELAKDQAKLKAAKEAPSRRAAPACEGKARSDAEAVSIVRQESGTHLDRTVVSALLRTLGEDSGSRWPAPPRKPAHGGPARFRASLVAIHR
ncbi:MAG: hypothetical protein ACHQ0J_03515 [Candidatus Dormibacterales bacterium]